MTFFDIKLDIVLPKILISKTTKFLHKILKHLPKIKFAFLLKFGYFAVAGSKSAVFCM